MRRLILKILYLLAVFGLSLLIFLRFTGHEEAEQTAVLESAGLPVVRLMFEQSGREAASLYGYTDEMDVRTMRGGILPVGDDRHVSIRIVPYGAAIEHVRFEVRDITGDNLVEQTEITERRETSYGDIDAGFTLKDLLHAGAEYILIVRLDTARGTISYYSRIMRVSDEVYDFVEETVEFASDFHDKTFDESRRQEIVQYIEPSRSGDNTTFAAVDIHSSLTHICWGGLDIHSHDVPKLQINDIRDDIVTMTLAGNIVIQTEDERRLPLEVREDFRLRRGRERLYLLDYDRTARYLFSGDPADFGTDRINLGIGPEDFPFMESEDGGVVAFAAGHKLYSFRKDTSELSVLFSFEDNENADERCVHQDHDFHLLGVDDNGDVRFLVAGYMNRGDHEGRVGVAYYLYDATIKQLKEMVFLPVNTAPEILRAYVRRMSHVSGQDELYLMIKDDVVLVDPDDKSVHLVIKDAALTPYFRSASGALFARSDSDAGDKISVMRFKDGEILEVEADPGTRLIPLGFMQEDLVYGVVRERDIRKDQTGTEVYAMESVLIRDAQGDILEHYQSPGNYVVDARVEGNQIRLYRVRLNEETGFYEETAEDQIINTLEARARVNRVITVATDVMKKLVEIDCRQEFKGGSLKTIIPAIVVPEELREAALYTGGDAFTGYYVYAIGGRVEDLYAREADALRSAAEGGGAVVDGNDLYVWEKRGLQARNQIMALTNIAQGAIVRPGETEAAFCLRLMLEHRGINRDVQEMLDNGDSLAEILDKSLTDCRSLTLTGCDLTSILYYVNRDIPVLVSRSDGGALLLIGFNDSELVIVDPNAEAAEERVYKITRSQGKTMFEENGNRFITYYLSSSPAL